MPKSGRVFPGLLGPGLLSPHGTGLAEFSGSPRQLDTRPEPRRDVFTAYVSQLPGGPEQASHPLHRPTGDHTGLTGPRPIAAWSTTEYRSTVGAPSAYSPTSVRALNLR
jgi:hypothetical protein